MSFSCAYFVLIIYFKVFYFVYDISKVLFSVNDS